MFMAQCKLCDFIKLKLKIKLNAIYEHNNHVLSEKQNYTWNKIHMPYILLYVNSCQN